ncbi:MAG: mannitol dehydrogenase family protein [Marmoricola sp.]
MSPADGPAAGGRPLSRVRDGRPAAPVAAAHLGLGSFFRAHQAVFTDRAPDAEQWGIAAFTGRTRTLADQMAAQDGLYTLVERGPAGAECSVVSSVSRVGAGGDVADWLTVVGRSTTRLVTLTVTEAGYRRTDDGGLCLDDPEVRADLAALRAGDLVSTRTVPGRLTAALRARYDGAGAPLAVVPCDNLLQNGKAVRRVVSELAEEVDEGLADWVRASVSFVDSEVDRITPRTTEADRLLVARATGVDDACPVVTEPFTEWVISGDFPSGRPGWEHAGAQLVDDVTPFEQRKLWLLNGAHSMLAYAGSIRGHVTVAAAVTDEVCLGWLQEWWDEAGPHVDLPAESVEEYRAALLARFANEDIQHRLEQIAADGSQKLPVRVLPVLAAERTAGRLPTASARTLGAWVAHLRGAGALVTDPRADELAALAAGPLPEAVRRVLGLLDPGLPDDPDLVTTVTNRAQELSNPW